MIGRIERAEGGAGSSTARGAGPSRRPRSDGAWARFESPDGDGIPGVPEFIARR
ncbi:MAG TPA: hypothetical protein VGH45_07870 [Solirubrobacteraceae bacterium]|jgi:hypothetical protein